MAGWVDVFSLLVTVGVFGGTIYGIVYVVKQVTQSIQETKAKMKDKGYDISHKGVSIKTTRRFDRQDYIDATQRSMMKTMTATSFNRRADSLDGSGYSPTPNSGNSANPSPVNSATSSSFAARPGMERAPSSTSSEKKKKGLFASHKNSL